MSNVFVDIAVPAAEGVGASSDVSTVAAEKTITISGNLGGGTVTVEVSHDDVNYHPICSFTAPGKRRVIVAAAYMRCRAQGGVGVYAADADVAGAEAVWELSTLNVPAGNGTGAAVDSSALGQTISIMVSGTFTGTVTVELSADGASFAPLRSFTRPGIYTFSATAEYLRVVRSGVGTVPGTPTVTAASATHPSFLSLSRTFTVSPSGGEFTTIEDAITAANALVPPLSEANPAAILVYPGTYVENPLTLPSHVGLIAMGNARATWIEAATATAPIITVSADSTVEGFSIRGANGVGGVGVYSNSVGQATARHMEVYDCTVGYMAEGAGVELWCALCDAKRRTGEVLSYGLLCIAGAKLEAVTPHVEGESGAEVGVGSYTEDAGSLTHLYAIDFEECDVGVSVDDGGHVDVMSGFIHECDVQYHIGSTGGSARIDASGIGSHDIDTWGLLVEHATAIFRGNGVQIRTDQISITAGADVLSSHLSAYPGDEALDIIGQLSIGLPGHPSSSSFGEGGSHVRTMAVYRNTNLEAGVWSDITAELLSPDGSTADLFAGVAAGNCAYIGSSEKQFPSIRTLTTAAIVLGAGAIDLEYWNGASWVAIHYMAADAQTPWAAHGETAFARVQADHVRCPTTLTGWAQKSLNGSAARWWVRWRVTSGITTSPTLEQIKLGTNRSKLNSDGTSEYFGSGRPRSAIPFHKRLMLNFTGGGAPGNANVPYSANVTLAGTNNVFADGGLDGLGGVFTIPEGLDTSMPLTIEWNWAPASAPGSPSQVEFEGYYGQVKQGAIVNGSITDTHYSKVVVTTGGAQYQVYRSSVEIDGSALEAGELLDFTLYRDAGGGNPDDTLIGNVWLLSVEVFGYFWR